MRWRHAVLVAAAAVLAGCGAAAAPAPPPDATRTPAVTMQPAPRAEIGPEAMVPVVPAPPRQPANPAALRVLLVPDPCVDRDLVAPAAHDDALTLLDRTYRLPPGFVPDDLVVAAEAGFDGASGARLVSAAVVDDLAALLDASRSEGLRIVLDSGYRSLDAQAATYDAWAARLGSEAASQRAARPGHSEHHLGTAIDVSSPGWSGRFGDWALETAEGAWMADHAWEYGFVMSFPAGAEAETCFGYEPWHYRWIGRDLAAEHQADGRPLRNFLADRLGG